MTVVAYVCTSKKHCGKGKKIYKAEKLYFTFSIAFHHLPIAKQAFFFVVRCSPCILVQWKFSTFRQYCWLGRIGLFVISFIFVYNYFVRLRVERQPIYKQAHIDCLYWILSVAFASQVGAICVRVSDNYVYLLTESIVRLPFRHRKQNYFCHTFVFVLAVRLQKRTQFTSNRYGQLSSVDR